MNLHDEIRRIANEQFVRPARASNRVEFSIAVKDLMKEAKSRGISPTQRVPAFCNSIRTREFLEENGLQITRITGPASKLSTTVVVDYRFATQPEPQKAQVEDKEYTEQRALRLAEKLRGLMKTEIAERGGAEGFLRWVRSEDAE